MSATKSFTSTIIVKNNHLYNRNFKLTMNVEQTIGGS